MNKYIEFFNNYTNHYMKIAKNDFQRIHINRKIEHSKRVYEFSVEIAIKLGLTKKDIYIISIASLLHDIGRIKQFYEYSTYRDDISINHALLGVEILEKENVLDELEQQDKKMILEIIKLHNYKDITNVDEKLYLYTSIIRDADKIDWLYAMVNIIPSLSKENQAVFYSDKEDKNYISKELVDSILNDKTINKSEMTTIDELRAVSIGWITSSIVNKPSIDIIKSEDLINKTYKLMYNSKEKDMIFNYINSVI